MYINKNPLKAQNNGTYMRKAVNIKKDVKYISFYLQSKKHKFLILNLKLVYLPPKHTICFI